MNELTTDEREFIVRQFLDLKYLIDKEAPTTDMRIEAWEHHIYTRKSTGTRPVQDAFSINLMKAEIKELKRREKTKVTSTTEPVGKAKKAKGIHYVLAYIFDCIATGVMLSEPFEQGRLERICEERYKDVEGAIAGNTFYKIYGNVRRIDLNSLKAIKEIAGEDWGKIIISLSKHPDKVKKLLKDKGLT